MYYTGISLTNYYLFIMEHFTRNISYQRQRHFKETKTICAISLILLGFCFLFSLVLLWPQYLLAIVFNSRLSFHSIITYNDYLTCNNDYNKFLISQPLENEQLQSFYIFNITNIKDVIEIGNKPIIKQVGPYGYRKYSYKYDVSFDSMNSSYVKYKEYTILQSVSDITSCKTMYYQMDRAYSTIVNDPCSSNKCNCKDDENDVVIVTNPLFLKFMTKETPYSILAQYSIGIFQNIRNILENDFILAIKSFLVHQSYQEIYIFRKQIQMLKVLDINIHSLLSYTSINEFISIIVNKNQYKLNKLTNDMKSCGTNQFVSEATSCPLIALADTLYSKMNEYSSSSMSNITLSLYLNQILNESNTISILHHETGLPKWLGLIYYSYHTTLTNYYNYPNNYPHGYTTIAIQDYMNIYQDISNQLVELSSNDIDIHTIRNTSYFVIDTISQFLLDSYLIPSDFDLVYVKLVNEEFYNSSSFVPCDPLARQCIWQLGYIRQHNQSFASYNYSTSLINTLIDPSLAIESNLIQLYYDNNVYAYYNTFIYYNQSNHGKICLRYYS